jgi:nitroimidazol reductase NimA-like FMN-containing flavoprotein (pyridoxamine 5'-phosphate oxidase superfamily)
VQEGVEILPPLPEEVVALLQATRLCHLSTFGSGVPHLSLMNFTYVQGL